MYATALTKTDLSVLLIDKFPGVGLTFKSYFL